ncbi:MAG: hypothetical protein KC645_12210 [Gemmatimonadetes bacterium]|nr:hypothetical protein [Gemmatimonadota bacterium]
MHPFRSPRSTLLFAVLALAFAAPDALTAQSLASEHLSGLPFRTIGPAAMSGRIVDLAVVESDPDVFYVATSTGGVWKTTNRAVTLTPVFEHENTHSVGAITVHQRDTSIVWVGTGERASRQSSSWGDGVYKSTDGGTTWTHMGLSDSKHIGRIVLHPDNPDIVWVAAMGHLWGPNEERGLYKSTDGGRTWTRVLNVDRDTGVVDVALDPSDPNTLYASSYQRRRRPYGFNGGGPGSALWKSTDGGETWNRLTGSGMDNGLPTGEMGRIGISVYRSDPRIVYVSIEQGERYNASTAYEQRAAGIYRSEDRGATWTHMGDWNPRPMYASQILVDPSDDQRIYMVNTYSWSDDGGKTFTVPDQSLHGDDRLVWVDPTDSNHVMKADDGGLGLSWDRGVTWLYISDLPVSQFYRVTYDLNDPYRVYGGLQDNGSWGGPNQVFRSEGIINADWQRYGGGDGFLNLVDTTTNRWLYTESQYLGLDRVDLVSGERTSIRPGDSIGAIGGRRNWSTWPDPTLPDERLGNAMAPANWEGPFLISPHNAATIYAGTDVLWRSRDRGERWEHLGNLTTGVKRQTLPIMGQMPDSSTLSLDDGIPYYPTLSAIAESPLLPGVLYVGTDDGQVQVSRDAGERWEEVSARLPGLPDDAWINDIEVSRHAPGRAYVSANNYRNDDYANYLYRTDDFGRTWRAITGDLPAERVVRVLREDLDRGDVLYLGTEFGLWYSMDAGAHWVELRSNLPLQPINDIRIHPHERDLILGTHGRGIWILDQNLALSHLTPDVMGARLHAFPTVPARQIRYRSELPHTGDVFYQGENPPAAALVDYWLGADSAQVVATVLDRDGTQVARVTSTGQRGLNRLQWDLRHTAERPAAPQGRARRGPSGPLVVPGLYTVRLESGGTTSETQVEVREDPRIDASIGTRTAWTQMLLDLYALRHEAEALQGRVADGNERLRAETNELVSRISGLVGEAEDRVGPLTADQASERAYYERMLRTLGGEVGR